MSMDWVRRRHGVPAVRGGRVRWFGQPGRILSARGGLLKVRLDEGYLVTADPANLEYLEEKKP